MNIYVKSEKKALDDLPNILMLCKEIKDGFSIIEAIDEVSLKIHNNEDIKVADSFYSITVFNPDEQLKIIRDGEDLYLCRISENKFDDADEKTVENHEDRTYYLKGKYDTENKFWWESQYGPNFKYPQKNEQNIKDKSRAGLMVKIYRNDEGETKYYRFTGYEQFMQC